MKFPIQELVAIGLITDCMPSPRVPCLPLTEESKARESLKLGVKEASVMSNFRTSFAITGQGQKVNISLSI